MPISIMCTSGTSASSRTALRGIATRSSLAISPRACASCAPADSTPERTPELRTTSIYTSHEALLLGYEQACTRVDFDLGRLVRDFGSFSLGRRPDAELDQAHVEYLRGIKNPIGAKCGPSLAADELLRLIDMLNPANEPGRLTLICRFGADKVAKHLPALIRVVEREGRSVVWACDPMHGNTIKAAGGYKTRPFDLILREVETFFDIHRSESTHAGASMSR